MKTFAIVVIMVTLVFAQDSGAVMSHDLVASRQF